MTWLLHLGYKWFYYSEFLEKPAYIFYEFVGHHNILNLAFGVVFYVFLWCNSAEPSMNILNAGLKFMGKFSTIRKFGRIQELAESKPSQAW